MAHYDVFRQELAIRYSAYGHALWEPSPGPLFPPVEIGDVGFIRCGKFHRLFNALLPEDHPSHQNFGVPERHEPLQLNMPQHIDTGTLCPNNFRSVGVAVVSNSGAAFASGPEPDHVSFSCSKKTGAILSLPVPAKRQDTLAQGVFGRWIVKHIDPWFAFTRRLGLGIRMEDIVLVTGCHLVRSWANLAFLEGSGNEQVSFGVQVIGNSTVVWQFPPEEIQGVSSNLGPNGRNLPEDQCIFVRGFRASRLLGLLSRLRGAAQPTQSPNEDENEDTYLINMPADNKSQDPLHVLMEYIATQGFDCDVALVHDDDLKRIVDSDRALETLKPDELMVRLRTSTPQIWRIQCDSSEAQTQTPKVATLTKDSLVEPKGQEPDDPVEEQGRCVDKGGSTVTRRPKPPRVTLNYRDASGWTSLHSASSEGQIDVIRALLESGADATARDNTGSTPLHWASCMGHVEVTRALLKGGAEVAAQDSNGSTPLHWASSRGHVEVVRTLLEGSADVTARNKKGWTPLHSASSEGRVGTTRALLEGGADATAQDLAGLTPLYWATAEGHVGVVRALLDGGDFSKITQT